MCYSLFIIGWASRSIATESTVELVLLLNYSSAAAILQGGLGTYVVRQVARARGRAEELATLSGVRGVFYFSLVIASVTTGVVVVAGIAIPGNSHLLAVLFVVWPPVFGIADQVRLASEQARQSNLYVFIAYLVGATFALVLALGPSRGFFIFSALCYGPTLIGSVLSFCGFLRRSEARQLLSLPRGLSIVEPFLSSVPLLLIAVGTASLINVPALGNKLLGQGSLSGGAAGLLRLDLSIQSVFFFAFQAAVPSLIRSGFTLGARDYSVSVARWFVTVAVVAFCAFVGMALFGGLLVNIWLNKPPPSLAECIVWAAVLGLWLLVTSLGQFMALTGDTRRVAIACAFAAISVWFMPLLMHLSGRASDPGIYLAIGLSVYLVGLYWQYIRPNSSGAPPFVN